MFGPAEDGPRLDVGGVARQEIVAGAVVIHLAAGTSGERLVSVAHLLAAIR
ncbi:hypothetical protein [Gemmobacter sp. 24YEA27]|uniref:hypothetical protein n=1 Tax=Gemmobacter sp. 24YEA27 TaxID=3040672 RepID=UPI0024B390CE|nr:hypothetical protein [Gemmobacter sp. 24YEA27]